MFRGIVGGIGKATWHYAPGQGPGLVLHRRRSPSRRADRMAVLQCNSWCTEPCVRLNGNLTLECGACEDSRPWLSSRIIHRCRPGFPDFENWYERRKIIAQRVIVVTPTTSRDDTLVASVATAIGDAIDHAAARGYNVTHRLYQRRSDWQTCTLWTHHMPSTACVQVDDYAQGDMDAVARLFGRMLREAAAAADFVVVVESDMLPPRDALTALLDVLESKRADVVAYPWQFNFLRKPVILTTVGQNFHQHGGYAANASTRHANASTRLCSRMPRFDDSIRPAFWLDFGLAAMVRSVAARTPLRQLPCMSVTCNLPGADKLPDQPSFWRLSGFDAGWSFLVSHAYRTRTVVIDRLVPHRPLWLVNRTGEPTWPLAEALDFSLRPTCLSECSASWECDREAWKREQEEVSRGQRSTLLALPSQEHEEHQRV